MKLLQHFLSACRAVVLCLFAPSKFESLAKKYDANLPPIEESDQRARQVSRGFWLSLGLTIGSMTSGYFFGKTLKSDVGPLASSAATALQFTSAAFLLVGTLAPRGWQIQTWHGNTLAEKVSQWLARTLFVIGTFVITLYLGWAAKP